MIAEYASGYIVEIAFATALIIYMIHRTIEKNKKILDSDLLNSMNSAASSLKNEDSLETALYEMAKGKDKAAKMFREILDRISKGKSLSEAFQEAEKKNDSIVLGCFSKIVSAYEKSGEDVSDQLKEASSKMLRLKQVEEEMYGATATAIMVVQIMAIFIAPATTLYLSGILGIQTYLPSFYFMGFSVAVYSMLDYVMYSDYKESLFILPLFITGYLIVINRLAPYVISFFMTIF